MYPLVELATGLLFVGCYLEFGITQATVKWLFFICLIIILTVTDLRVRLASRRDHLAGIRRGSSFLRLCAAE